MLQLSKYFTLPSSEYINLVSLSAVIAIITFVISLKHSHRYTELAAIPIVSVISFLFAEDEGFSIRIHVALVMLVSYSVSYGFLFLIKHIISKLVSTAEKGNNAVMAVHLPLDYNLPVDNSFLDDVPANVSALLHLGLTLELLTHSFIERFCLAQDNSQKEDELKGYFLGICYHLSSLFEPSTRVHVRILKGGCYQKYIAVCDNLLKENSKSMKTMSLENKMINESFKNQCSLIKTFNLSLHEDGSNHKWKNYLTFAIPQILHDGRPVFSFGISITKKKHDLLYFLNYCEIERLIGGFFEEILNDEKCAFKEFVEHYFFESS